MKTLRLLCIFFILSAFSRLYANPWEQFIKQNNLTEKDEIKILVFNTDIGNCVKCTVIGSVIQQQLNEDSNYYIIFYGISEKKADYYLKHILKAEKKNTKILVNDSLFNYLSPDLATRLILSKGTDIYFNKTALEVNTPLNLKNIPYQINPNDSIVLQDNIVPIDSRYLTAFLAGDNQVLVYDEFYNNAVVYNKQGQQNKLLEIDSSEIKFIYEMVMPNENNWAWVYYSMQEFKKYMPLPYQLSGFYSDKKYIYALVSFNFPKFIPPKLTDFSIGADAVYVFDTNWVIQDKYLISGLDKFKQRNYYCTSSFSIHNDTLCIGIVNYLQDGKINTDTSVRQFALFALKNQKFIPYKICGKMPTFFNADNAKLLLMNHIYHDALTNDFIAPYKYLPTYYNFKTASIKNIPGVPDRTYSANDYRICYYFNSQPVEKHGFSYTSQECNFIVSYNHSYYLILTDSEGRLIRKIQLSKKGAMLEGVQFFNDEHYLYAISGDDNSIKEYKYLLSNLE